jgi:hypothetical protein
MISPPLTRRIANETRWLVDAELPRQDSYRSRRRVGQVIEECTQEADGDRDLP